MNFVLFFGGLSVLVGSCVIVCVCNQCKRRRMRNKGIRKLDIKRPPSVSFVIEPDTKPNAMGGLKAPEFTISPPKQFLPVSDSSVSSKDSSDSSKSLISSKNTLNSSSCLVLPSVTANYDRRSSTHSVIPTIYISPT